jgi:hypothetical protein
MTDGYRSLEDRPFGSFYLYVETTLDHPVENVWPHALNIGSWMSAHGLETISGESGKVGHFERVLPRGLPADVPQPHYHLYGITKIIPHKLIALEVFPERGGSYGVTKPWVSFDNILLTDLGGRTRVVFLMVDAHLGPHDEEYNERRAGDVEGGRDLLNGYFENLRRLVDGSARA